jgi:hypothetical protein
VCAMRKKRWWTHFRRWIVGYLKRSWTHCKPWIVAACSAVGRWVIRTFSISEGMVQHGVLFLAFGFLLLTFKSTSEPSLSEPPPITPSTWESMGFSNLIPSPDWISDNLRWIFAGASLMIMCLFFCLGWKKLLRKWLAIMLVLLFLFASLWFLPPINPENFRNAGIFVHVISAVFLVAVFVKPLANWFKDLLEGDFKTPYWIVFWIVFFVSAFEWLARTATDSSAFPFAGWLVVFWSFVILIISLKTVVWDTAKKKALASTVGKKSSSRKSD